jgi:hypothetical protein
VGVTYTLSGIFIWGTAAYRMFTEQPSLFNSDDEGQLEPLAPEWHRPEGVCFWGADYGAQGKKIAIVRSDDPDKKQHINVDKFLTLGFAEPGDYVVIENAHVAARDTRVSLAQPLTFEQLVSLRKAAKQKNIKIKLFPQSQTYKYRNTIYGVDSEKTDHNDAHAVVHGALHLGVDSLQNFEPKQSGVWTDYQQWCFSQKEEMNQLLNLYRIDHNCEDSTCLILFQKCKLAFDRALLELGGQGDEARRWFAKDNLKEDSKTSAPLALWVSLVAWDGSARRYRGRDIGINSVMRDLLGNKPMHFRGGVARSNIWHWGFKKICNQLDVGKDVPREPESFEYQKFQEAKRRYRRAMKIALKALREVHQRKGGYST